MAVKKIVSKVERAKMILFKGFNFADFVNPVKVDGVIYYLLVK